MIIITGATGQLGRAVVEQLLKRTPASGIGVSVRDPQKASDLAALGARVRRGDYRDAASLEQAFEGATQVLIVSANSAGDHAVEQHQTAIDAARLAGARRVLYTSQMGADAASAFPPMRDHAATEALLQTSGLPFTSLRNGFYAASGLMLLGAAPQTGEVAAPADGPVAWTTHADLAEATAILLADEGRLDGVTPPLTAGETHDLANLAALAAELTGRPISRVTVPADTFRTTLLARGAPAPQVDMMLGLYEASRQGAFSATDPTLANLLGRPPVPMRDFLARRIESRH